MVCRWIAVPLFLVASVASCGECGQEKESSPTASTAEPTMDLTVPEEQVRIIQETRAALEFVAAKSSSAKQVLAFYDENAIVARSEGNQMRVVTAPPPGQTFFFIVGDPTPVKVKEGAGGVFARFECGAPFPRMKVHAGQTAQLIRGLMLAHELEHAGDCLLHGEPESQFLDDTWLLGELHAHARVSRILDQWTEGGWNRIVEASQKRREAIAVGKGSRPESSIFGQLPEDHAAIVQQFGELDAIGLGLLFFQLDVDANLKNVGVQMKKYGRPEEERTGHYLEVLRVLYGQHQSAITEGR
jgi:hypothetical protein